MGIATANFLYRMQFQQLLAPMTIGGLAPPSRTLTRSNPGWQMQGNHTMMIYSIWVPGHRSIHGNEEADRLAKKVAVEAWDYSMSLT